MSDASIQAAAAPPDAMAAAMKAPSGLALMTGDLPPDLARQVGSDMADVNGAIRDAMGLGELPAVAGTDPKAQPDSERVPDQATQAKRQQAPTAAESISALIGSFAHRVQNKRAQRMSLAVGTMFRAAVAYEASAKSYNELARLRAPVLYQDAAEVARKTGRTERQVLAAAMDTRIKDPALDPIRDAMRKLADDPEMAGRRREMHEVARRFEDRAGQVSRLLANVDPGKDPLRAGQVGEAVDRLRTAIDTKLSPRISALPELDAQVPSTKPDAALGRFKAGFDDLSKKMEELAQRVASFVSSALGRR